MSKSRYSSTEGNFVVVPFQDNWRNYNYDQRYLDALANILLVRADKNTVSAICMYNNKLYMSYNRECIPINS